MANESKGRAIGNWVLAVLLGLAFIGAGFFKLSGNPEAITNFARWGYPDWFRLLTGAIEVFAAVLILIPRTRFYGAAIAACTMVGAVITHLRVGEYGFLAPPLVLLTLALILAALNRQRGPAFVR